MTFLFLREFFQERVFQSMKCQILLYVSFLFWFIWKRNYTIYIYCKRSKCHQNSLPRECSTKWTNHQFWQHLILRLIDCLTPVKLYIRNYPEYRREKTVPFHGCALEYTHAMTEYKYSLPPPHTYEIRNGYGVGNMWTWILTRKYHQPFAPPNFILA